MLPAFPRLHHRPSAELLQKVEACAGLCRLGIQPGGLFLCEKIKGCGNAALPGDAKRLRHQRVDAFMLGGGDGHHGDAEGAFQRMKVDSAAISAYLVHHVQRQHHGDTQRQQLDR